MSRGGHGQNNQKSCRHSYLGSSDCAPSYSELETGVCTTHLHTNVHRNFIHSCQNLDAIKMSFSKRMDKLVYIQTMGYYSTQKGNGLTSHEKTWRKLKCILLSERSQSERATYCMTVCMCVFIIFWKIMKTMKTVKRSMVARGWREGMMNRWNIEDFQGGEITVYNTIMVDTYYFYTFSQTHRMSNTKCELSCKLCTLDDKDVGLSVVIHVVSPL